MEFSFSDEQKAFKDQVLKFSRKELAPLAEEADWKAEFCWEAWKKMGGFGLLGITYPEAYGGSGADVVTACLAGEGGCTGSGRKGGCAWPGEPIHTSAATRSCAMGQKSRSKGMCPTFLPGNGWGPWVSPSREPGRTPPRCALPPSAATRSRRSPF